jgi:hypothetical protein
LENEKYIKRLLALSFILFTLISTAQGTSSQQQQQSHSLKYDVTHSSIAYAASGQQTNGSRLNVTFDSIFINNDHDPVFSGEWKLEAFVNGQRVKLLPISTSDGINSSETISFTNKSLILTIPSNGTLRIVTVGAEFDDNHMINLTDISGILRNDDLPFIDYVDEATSSISSLVAFDMNDLIGTIAKEYLEDNNFGVGQHDDCSESSLELSGDLYQQVDTNCEFRLRYHIEKAGS